MTTITLETKIHNHLDKVILNELLPNQLYLINEYDLDISFISSSINKDKQVYIEKLFLGTLYLIDLLDEFYIEELQETAPENIPKLEDDFFKCLGRLSKITEKKLGLKKYIDEECIEKVSGSINEINTGIANNLENWFEEKKRNLKTLFSDIIDHPQKDMISQNILHAILSWRNDYIQTKQEKVRAALEQIDNLKVEQIKPAEPLSEEEKDLVLKDYFLYSPFYALTHLDAIPVELALNLALSFNEINPKLTEHELLKIEEANNIYVIEYLKLLNVSERDRNKILHTLNAFSEHFKNQQ